jgi:predicted TIM-barrel fold metal-dependent hydrolase
MTKSFSLKIDSYSHIIPLKYKEVVKKIAPKEHDRKIVRTPPLYDLDSRFRVMDKFEPLKQILTLAWPPVEDIASQDKSAELARIANDGMAELVLKYPDRFVAAIGILPMNNMDAVLEETDRVIKDLRFKGVYLHTPVQEKPLDSPDFFPLYKKMVEYDLPIYIHPMKMETYPDYEGEKKSKFRIYATFGWPHETSKAMARLVYSGIMEKFQGLKVITHHCGGMVPYYAERIIEFTHHMEIWGREEEQHGLRVDPIDYFRKIYADTALYGNRSALMCAYDFFGADQIIFGTDMPLGDTDFGNRNYYKTIEAIEGMDITESERKKIYEDNARRIMRLPI